MLLSTQRLARLFARAGRSGRATARPPRGAAAVEFAIGVPIVMSLFIGGFVLVYATFTRQRLTTAVVQAARTCSIRPVNEGRNACVRNTVLGLLAEDNARCAGGVQFQVNENGNVRDPRVISVLSVTARCAYSSPVWPNALPAINLQASAQMPQMPVAGP
jgi:Flp pilus assembly protein TadG